MNFFFYWLGVINQLKCIWIYCIKISTALDRYSADNQTQEKLFGHIYIHNKHSEWKSIRVNYVCGRPNIEVPNSLGE